MRLRNLKLSVFFFFPYTASSRQVRFCSLSSNEAINMRVSSYTRGGSRATVTDWKRSHYRGAFVFCFSCVFFFVFAFRTKDSVHLRKAVTFLFCILRVLRSLNLPTRSRFVEYAREPPFFNSAKKGMSQELGRRPTGAGCPCAWLFPPSAWFGSCKVAEYIRVW